MYKTRPLFSPPKMWKARAQRSYSLKCHRQTIGCHWIPLLKLAHGFGNQSENRTASKWHDATTFTIQKLRIRTQFVQRLRRPCSIQPARSCCCTERTTINGTMPGGTLDFGESLARCAIREVLEETGLSDSNYRSNRHIHGSPNLDRV
jgi:hypothetical protein